MHYQNVTDWFYFQKLGGLQLVLLSSTPDPLIHKEHAQLLLPELSIQQVQFP